MRVDAAEFAVVDVETTGLYPGGTDRILEIAVLRMHADGTILDEYCTLVNPDRDVGPTPLHGIEAGDVRDAPTFAEVAPDVLLRMADAVFVAHNSSFDARFVRAEMEWAGFDLPPFAELCTLRLSRLVDPAIPSRKLVDLCDYFGIELRAAHTAYDDALATSQLLSACFRELEWEPGTSLEDVGVRGAVPPASAWPCPHPLGCALRRSEARRRRSAASSLLVQLLGRLPASGDHVPEREEYLALLDRVLEDRRVDPEEGKALEAMAEEAGLSGADLVAAHESYYLDLLRAALEDGVITASETRDLAEVRQLLGIDEPRAAELLAEANASERVQAGTRRELDGRTVCFTGTLRCSVDGMPATKSDAERAAEAVGMQIRKGVSKKLDILVTADPDSLSGKAKRARSLGVRLMAEPVFWRLVGLQVE